ncbi:MAG: FkbM family methyltransferase [Lewinellaceae bacterium]|nr:FkbM family methyltransferase [Lewinellaceae bacterium]
MAVSNQNGFAKFNIAKRSRSSNYLADVRGASQTGGVRKTIYVPVITLDSFLEHYKKPDFIKIDVEGAEHLVFEGMKTLLSSVKPTILCEVDAANKFHIGDTLKKHRYKMFDAEQLPTMVGIDIPSYNTLAIPE